VIRLAALCTHPSGAREQRQQHSLAVQSSNRPKSAVHTLGRTGQQQH
jgi:hypothetical protein